MNPRLDPSGRRAAALHPALLHDVRLHLHGLPVAVPAAADGALPHPRPRGHRPPWPGSSSACSPTPRRSRRRSRAPSPTGSASASCCSITSLAIAGFSVAYALSRSYWIPLVLVFFHGLFWSGLLSASSAYMTEVIPESRRAEGIGYWGMSTMLATAVAPWLGLWVYQHGWAWLCAGTAAPEPGDGRDRLAAAARHHGRRAAQPRPLLRRLTSSSGAWSASRWRSSSAPSATAGSRASWR